MKHVRSQPVGTPRLRSAIEAAVRAGGESAGAARTAHAALQRERPTLLQMLIATGAKPQTHDLLDVLPPLAPRW